MNFIVRPIQFAFLAAISFASTSQSLAFDYAEGDLMIGMRQPQGSYELVVNLGPAKNLNTYAQANPGATFKVTQYSKETLSQAFSDLSGVYWSAFGSIITVGAVEPPYASVWATRPRSDFLRKTDSWYGRVAFSQSQTASSIGSIGAGAKSAPGSSTATSVVLDGGVSYGYASRVGALGDFGGKWIGSVEGAITGDLVDSNGTNRIDLYYVAPDPTNAKRPGRYLGYFDFAWDGTISFTAATASPTLASIAPASGVSGGTVTLTGGNFVNGAVVYFDGVKASSVNVASGTSLTAVVPAHDAGAVNVEVVNPDGQHITLSNSFTYGNSQPPTRPTIVKISKIRGDFQIITSSDPNVTEHVLVSTAVDAPFASWTSVATNVVGPTGFFTNAMSGSVPMKFMRIVIP